MILSGWEDGVTELVGFWRKVSGIYWIVEMSFSKFFIY
jgi:hypothetical protein